MRPDWLTRFFAKGTSNAGKSAGGGQLPPPVDPKVKGKQQSIPSHMQVPTPLASPINRKDLNLANQDIAATYRFGASTSDVLRTLVRANPDFSAALSSHLRLGIPEKYIAPAYNPDGTFNVEATALAMELLARIDTMPGYETGFTTTGSVRSTAEALAKEGVIEGAMAMELVLNAARQPVSFAPVTVAPSKFRFYDDWGQGIKTLRPVQVIGGVETDIDIPNFFYVALDPSLLEAYAQAPMEAAIQPVLAASQFLTDLRRLCDRHVYPRYSVSIDEEKLKKSLPEEALLDSQVLAAKLNEILSGIQAAVNDLAVEESFIHFDFVTVEFIKGNDGNVPDTFNTVNEIFLSQIAKGARTLPSLIGLGAGTQNIASTETLVAMLTANSMVRLKLQEIFSKAMTLACRLFGYDVQVRFEYDEIELRPATELEAFKIQRQDRILQLVSLGYMLDEEACLRLTGRMPPTGFTVRWNTMFMDLTPAPAGNNYSGTGAGGGQSGGGAATQSRTQTAPTSNARGARK